MRLIDLIAGEKAQVTLTANTGELEITGLTADSRAVRPGFLFAALPGSKVDGRDYIASAVANGATAVLAPAGTKPVDGASLITAADARAALAHMSAAFYGAQPDTVAAVTGTNGKTSVAHFTRQIWTLLGRRAVSLGTLGLQMPDGSVRPSLTTPDPVTLHSDLAELAARKVSHAVLEASSHGLDQRRMDGVKLRAAGFTNLTRDHLDYHGTVENYLAAKTRLFADLLATDGVAVLNADVPEFPALAKSFDGRKLTYGRAGAELELRRATPTHSGTRATLSVLGRDIDIDLPLAGAFQTYNVLCAMGLAIGCGEDENAVVECLGQLQGVPGRMQLAGTVAGGSVYIDYAHTPDALENVLTALRPHTRGRLTAVIGCGGDRDRGKRPMMGSIAARLADHVIVTDDNPRSEDAASIRAEILAAAPNASETGDRAQAIEAAVAQLKDGDVAVIAGKGHETGQIVGDKILPFDDLSVARECIGAAGGRIS